MNFAVWIVLLVGSLGWFLRILIPIHDFWVYRQNQQRRALGQPKALRKSFFPILIFALVGAIAPDLSLLVVNSVSLTLILVFYVWSQIPSPEEVEEKHLTVARLTEKCRRRKIEGQRRKDDDGPRPRL